MHRFDTLVHQVSAALDEDLGPETRDLTAELIPASQFAEARLICREPALVAVWASEPSASGSQPGGDLARSRRRLGGSQSAVVRSSRECIANLTAERTP